MFGEVIQCFKHVIIYENSQQKRIQSENLQLDTQSVYLWWGYNNSNMSDRQ